MTLILAPEALTDIQHAFTYVHGQSPLAAQNLKTALNMSFDLLQARPRIGRLAKGEAREWSVSGWPYIIVYRVMDGDIEILRIWHSRQDRP